jgi:hypothetical protein
MKTLCSTMAIAVTASAAFAPNLMCRMLEGATFRAQATACAARMVEADEIGRLRAEMKAAVDAEDYAAAAKIRDRVEMLSEAGAVPVPTSPPERSMAKPPMSVMQKMEAPRLVSEADAQRTVVRRMPGFLSEADLESIHLAAETCRAAAASAGFKVSSTYERQVREGGRTVWLNHRVLELLPELHARMMGAAQAASRELWGGVLDDRIALHLRSSEYHTVIHDAEDSGRNIPMPVHADYGSLVTINLMLSDRSEYQGGTFQTLEADGSMLAHTFERGDALILLSHKWHSVTKLEGGRRNILVSEIWEGLPRRCPQRCDQPWLPCLCRMTEEGLYTQGAEARGICWRDGMTDAERLLVNGRAFWRNERLERERQRYRGAQQREGMKEAPRDAAGEESLVEWARRVKAEKEAADGKRRGEGGRRPGE